MTPLLPCVTSKPISFFVPGVPVPGGSKKAWLVHQAGCPAASRKHPGRCVCKARIALADAAGDRNKQWRYQVAQEAIKAMQRYSIVTLTGPLWVEMCFFIQRPKSHFNKKGQLVPRAPLHHAFKPDRTKLARAAEDALNKVLWADDSQIVGGTVEKRYTEKFPGLRISVLSLI